MLEVDHLALAVLPFRHLKRNVVEDRDVCVWRVCVCACACVCKYMYAHVCLQANHQQDLY